MRSPEDQVQITLQAMAARQSLLDRWAGEDVKQHPGWERRARLAARHIRRRSAVADIGCGNMSLERWLPEGCDYQPFDLVARDSRTRVIDLNREPLPALQVQVVVALGLLEYLFDPLDFLHQARRAAPRLIFSYHPADHDSGPHPARRRSRNWVSDLTMVQIVEGCLAAGFETLRLQPSLQQEYLFVAAGGRPSRRRPATAAGPSPGRRQIAGDV